MSGAKQVQVQGQRLPYHTLRFVLGAVFLLSAILKMRTLEELAYTVRLVVGAWSEMLTRQALTLPSKVWMFLAVLVIAAEMVLGVAFVFRIAVGRAALASAVVLGVFTLALVALRQFGHNCGCFGGASGDAVSIADMLRNCFLIGCSLALWCIEHRRSTIQS